MGLFEQYDAFAQQDIDLFFQSFAPNVPQGTAPVVDSVDGGIAPVAPGSVQNGGESDLDIDLAISLMYVILVPISESMAPLVYDLTPRFAAIRSVSLFTKQTTCPIHPTKLMSPSSIRSWTR